MPAGRKSAADMKTALVMPLIATLLSCAEPSSTHAWKRDTIEYYLNAEANYLTETVVRDTFDTWDEYTHFSFRYQGKNRAGIRHDGKSIDEGTITDYEKQYAIRKD